MSEELENYRKEIDRLDQELIALLGKRFEIVRAVGHLKSETGMKVIQSGRASAVKERAAQIGKENDLDPDFVKKLYELLIDHAHTLEHEISEKAGPET